MKDRETSAPAQTDKMRAASPVNENRRKLLWLIPAGVFSSITAVFGVAAARFLSPSKAANNPAENWINVAPLAALSGDQPIMRQLDIERDEGWRRAQTTQTVFVLPQKGNEVLSAICPHQGCTVIWRASEHDFFCPCHASRFNADGVVQTGPARSNLPSLPTRVVNGILQTKI